MSASSPSILTIPKPDDWHLHVRDGAMMQAVVPFSAQQFGRAVIMPNLSPPVLTSADALAYRNRVLSAVPQGLSFTPLMTAYLTDRTDPNDLEEGFNNKVFFAAKLFPAGATTNSDQGVTDMQAIVPVLERLQKIGMPLLIHGESANPDVDIFDREAVFIERTLIPLRRHFPELRIVMEHLTTRGAVQYVMSEGLDGKLAATITAHHLVMNRNAMLVGGIKPHNYCLPVAKREEDRQALVQAATSGAPMFFAGTDSAPHPRHAKECAAGKGGCFTAPLAVPLYVDCFDKAGALDKIEDFLCHNGAAFHNMPVSTETLTLKKTDAPLSPSLPVRTTENEEIVPFSPPHPLHWCLALG